MSTSNHDPNRSSQDGGDWMIPTDDLPPPPSRRRSRGDFEDFESAQSPPAPAATPPKQSSLALFVSMGLVLSLGVIGFLFVIVDEDMPPVVIGEREANEALEIKDESTGFDLPNGEGERAQEASKEVSPEESADALEREPIGRALPASTRPSRQASEREHSAPGDRSSAALTFGPPELEGHFDAQAVIKVLNREHRGQLFCYESGSRGTGQRPGTLTLSLIVSPLGGVVAASIRESTLNNRNIEDCLVRGARRWTFPEPPEGGTVRVNIPLVFTPASPK